MKTISPAGQSRSRARRGDFLYDEVAAVAARLSVEGLNEFPMLDGSTGLTKQGQFYTPFAVEALRITN